MSRNLIVVTVLFAFVVGLFTASTVPVAFAEDEKKVEEPEKKYPWADRDMNKVIKMTKLDYICDLANVKSIDEKHAVLDQHNGKPRIVMVKYKAEPKKEGLLLLVAVKADVKSRNFNKYPADSVAKKALHLWTIRHACLSNNLQPGNHRTWPIECRLVYKGKVIGKHIQEKPEVKKDVFAH